MKRQSRQTLNIRDERGLINTDQAARWADGDVKDCGGYVVVTRQGRIWTVSKRLPGWEQRVRELLGQN